MKKLFILFLLFFTTDSLASGIASNTNSAPCTNNTLETYSGNSNLSADWQPNEIQLRWYNGNTLLDVQSSANTCVYDGALTIPQTAPNRTGYTFAGWTVRPEMDFMTIVNEQGTESWGKGVYNNGTDRCWYALGGNNATSKNCNDDDNYKELQQHEWKALFEHGVLYGMAGCSTTSGSFAQRGSVPIDSGQYCWCKATGYKTTNSVTISGSLNPLLWVFSSNLIDEYTCNKNCAGACIQYVINRNNFRTALFTPASNN